MTTRKDIVGYGLWFAVVGAMLGGTGGGIYEYLSGISSWNGPVLIMFTAPFGLVCGILYGIWKKYY